MIVVGGVLISLTGLVGLLLLLGITNDPDVAYGLGVTANGLLIISGIFIAVSYVTKTYMQGFQEALRAVNKRVSNDLVVMKEKIDKLEKKKWCIK